MADESLFTSQTPDGNATDAGTPGGTTATALMFLADGVVKGIRFYATTVTGGDTYTAELWQLTANAAGSLIGTKASAGSGLGGTSPGWRTILFDTPVAVTAGVVYRAAQNNNHSGGARYEYALNFWASGGLTNGNIVGLQDGVDPGVGFTVSNGTSAISTLPGTLPSGSFSSTCYFIDVIFEADAGGGTDYPVSGVIAASSTAALAITAGRKVSGAIAASSTAALAITASRKVSGTFTAVSTASLALVGSAVFYVKRGGVAVLVTGPAGSVKRGGVDIPFG